MGDAMSEPTARKLLDELKGTPGCGETIEDLLCSRVEAVLLLRPEDWANRGIALLAEVRRILDGGDA